MSKPYRPPRPVTEIALLLAGGSGFLQNVGNFLADITDSHPQKILHEITS
jgi:hypothetical protein